MRVDGERVLKLPFLASGVTSVSVENAPIPFLAATDRLVVVLQEPTRTGNEITVRINYAAGKPGGALPGVASRGSSVNPAGYRDQWIIEGLSNYRSIATNPTVLNQARQQLLASAPEGATYDSLGPAWIGFRLIQPHENSNYSSTLKNKSIWIFHMLKGVIQRDERDPAFEQFLNEILEQYKGKTFSTFDLKRLAEKYAGKPLDWFFEDWVFGTGIPMYSITSSVEAAANGFIISGNITQSGVPDTFEMPVPVYADDTFLGNVVVSSTGGEFRFTSRVRPQQVLVDPKKTVLTQDFH
jgi:hypothetical protein